MNIDLSYYDPKKWKFNNYDISNEGYYLYDEDQRHPGWGLVKIGRPSGSTISSCINHATKYATQDEIALEICKVKVKEVSEEAKARMIHGVEYESIAREWYERKTNNVVKEMGYIIPSWDLRIGVSVDGEISNESERSERNEEIGFGRILGDSSPKNAAKEISNSVNENLEFTNSKNSELENSKFGNLEIQELEELKNRNLDKLEFQNLDNKDGIIEIKCPQRMYENLKTNIRLRKMGVKPKGFSHIPITHYDQMQLGMAIRRRSFCDYIVFCTSEDSVFLQRIPFDSEYWLQSMYPATDWFCKNKINPILKQYGLTNFPLMPSIE